MKNKTFTEFVDELNEESRKRRLRNKVKSGAKKVGKAAKSGAKRVGSKAKTGAKVVGAVAAAGLVRQVTKKSNE